MQSRYKLLCFSFGDDISITLSCFKLQPVVALFPFSMYHLNIRILDLTDNGKDFLVLRNILLFSLACKKEEVDQMTAHNVASEN